ncbi:PREDICTED: sporozoite surface protein 2-like [Nicrophorus vespilloides]|uniref:Sporozoite surface protein 2-like n=1 Tax=Nicrophorus vespilloides TaxID=110193 RepID=A0ABM1MIR0_NICVS|nr:PREDICTED: sporozoite surface protein 2-like [Nicrophorus vespilloides]
MEKLKIRKQIESLSSEQLAQELINNGYAFSYQAIIDKDITGKKMLNMTEMEKNELSFVMSRIQLQQFWSYVMSVKNDPTQMVLRSNNSSSIQKPVPPQPKFAKPPITTGGRFVFPPKPIDSFPQKPNISTPKPPQQILPPKPNIVRTPDVNTTPESEPFATSNVYPFGLRQVQKPAADIAKPSIVRKTSEKFETSSKYPFKFRGAEEQIANKEKEQMSANEPVDPFATSSVYPFKNRAKIVNQKPPSPVVEPQRNDQDKFAASNKYPFGRTAFENSEMEYPQQTVSDGAATSDAYPFKNRLPPKPDLPKPPEMNVFKKKPLPVIPAEKPKDIAPPTSNNYSYKQTPIIKVNDPNPIGLGKPKIEPPEPSNNNFLAKRDLISNIFAGNRPMSQPKPEPEPEHEQEDPIYGNVEREEYYLSADDSFASDESFEPDGDEPEYGNNVYRNVSAPVSPHEPLPMPKPMPSEDKLPLPPNFLVPPRYNDNENNQLTEDQVYQPVISVDVDQDIQNLLHPPLPRRPRVTILNLSRQVGNDRLVRSEQGNFLFRTSNTHYCVLMIKTNSGHIANIPIVKRDNRIHLDATNMDATKYFDNLTDMADYYKMQDTKMGNTTIRFRNMLT